MRTMRIMLVLGAAVALLFVVNNCSSCAEKVAEKAIEHQIEKETGQKADIDIDSGKDGTITMTTKNEKGEDVNLKINTDEDGSVTMNVGGEEGEAVFQIGANTKLPDGFPEDVPVPDGAEPAGVMFSGQSGGVVMFELTDSPDKLAKFYEKQMPAGGWERISKTEMQGIYVLGYKKGERSTNITIAPNEEEDGKTVLSLTVSAK